MHRSPTPPQGWGEPHCARACPGVYGCPGPARPHADRTTSLAPARRVGTTFRGPCLPRGNAALEVRRSRIVSLGRA
eukprot:1499376-Lingulodinium_polyedra.AAC.1